MKKIYNSKIFLIIISLIVSLTVWIYITGLESDSYIRTFKNVQVSFIGETTLRDTKGMVVTDIDNSSVTVEISGPRRIIASLSSTDIIAQIDVGSLTQSAYTSQQYSIVFPDGTDTTNISVLEKYPECINFMVSNLSEKTIQVKGSFEGEIAEGFTALKTTFDPETITVEGPAVYLNNIDYAWITFGEGKINSTYSEIVNFTLIDSNGDECSYPSLGYSTDTVLATIPILEVKEVPLDININYSPGVNDQNTIVTIEPKSITLSGDSSILLDVNKIVLGTIDTSSFSTTYQDKYPIKIDNELNNITGATEATVTIEIIGLESVFLPVSNISVSNIPDGYDVTILTEQINNVRIRGSQSVLDSIISENIRAVADLSDFTILEGVTTAKVKISIDGTNEACSIGDYFIYIEIRKSEDNQ